MTASPGSHALPDALPATSDRWNAWLRPLWIVVFAFAVLADIAGTAYVLHDTYENDPVFTAVGLNSKFDYDGTMMLGPPVGRESTGQGIVEDSTLLAIDGRPVPARAGIDRVARQLREAKGPVVTVRIRDPQGRVSDHRLTRSPIHAREAAAANAVPRNVRMATRLLFSLLGCITLLAGAVLLFMRRPRDPVALMLSFAFLGMAATIDPPLILWMALKISYVNDIISSGWWLLLVLALATFPDGRFDPAWLRWLLVITPPLAIFVSLPQVNAGAQLAVGLALPLGLLAVHLLRYRRLSPGIERQQIKWAAFGFAAGLVLISAALIAVEFLPPDGTPARPTLNLLVTCIFSLGFILMPLGLIVSVIRYRLWEADMVISRSAAYAVVTLVVGMVWAASADMVRDLVTHTLGEHNAPVATSLSAVIAAGVFAPTRAVLIGWTKRHFGKTSSRLHALVARLPVWANSEPPGEIGLRALATIADSLHASNAAIVALTPTGRELIAARDIADPQQLADPGHPLDGDPRFALALPLEDADGPVGTLLLGARSDGNRYNRDEREGLTMVLEPLAEALRCARSRATREGGMQQMIRAVEARLAQIETGMGGDPRPA